MLKVIIDGQPFSADISALRTLGELVELIKASIDPDSIIVGMLIEGRHLSESDWRAPLSVQGESTLEVETGGKREFAVDRIASSDVVLAEIIEEFKAAKDNFRNGVTMDANSTLQQAVEDLRAFLDWYQTLLAILEEDQDVNKQPFEASIGDIASTCEQLVQQQLYQSWWALGETLETKLEPQLEGLREVCVSMSGEVN